MSSTDSTCPRVADGSRSGWSRLAMCVVALVLVWGVVLPWIAETRAVRPIIQRNQQLGIDPSAMFYTDLEHLQFRDSMLRRIEPDAAGAGGPRGG